VVAGPAELLGFWNIFNLLPGFLVQQEKVHVLKEGVVKILAHYVISTSCDQKTLVNRKIPHGVADPSAWRYSLLLDFLPFDIYNFAFTHKWLDESKLVGKLTSLVFASKKVDAVNNLVS
jgi:hypothetical protein